MFPFKSRQRIHEPSDNVLQQLNRLERSSPDFPNLLASFFRMEEYKAPEFFYKLHNEDKVWLIEYLDNVCVRVVLSAPY